MMQSYRTLFILCACFLLCGCASKKSIYYQADYYHNYKEDYINSVTYYGYHPYNWGDGYLKNYGWGTRDWKQSTE